MDSRHITVSLWSIVTAVTWILAVAFLILAWIENFKQAPLGSPLPYASTAVFFSMIAALLSVRGIIARHVQSMKEAQRDWFQLGRDSVVEPLRAVNDRR